ncbi:hypothetical protein ACP70R_009660 [Stipagrostis hirtigluma subsp. patula]
MDAEASRERAGAVDRLSELPDCVLQDAILSHLTTRQAARTSVLSRRWRHLWRGVPCVDIDHCEFPRPPDIDRRADLDEFRRVSEDRIRRDMRQRVTFRDVVDAMLPSQSLRDAAAAPPPSLDAVRLRLSRLDFHAAWAWIRRGLERRPVAFHLRFDDDPLAFNEDDDPLAYYEDRHVGFPDLLFFPNDGAYTSRLRTLHLARMRLGDSLADALTTDFPVLEDLQLQDCRYAFRYLVSRSLKKLSMDKCGAEYGVNRLVLELPRIASLWIHRSSLPITMEDGMPSFATVSLTFTNDRSALDLLRSLRGARSLNLTQFSMTAWLDDDDEERLGGLPVFRNPAAELPDCVLQDAILSHLTTRQAARTSVLSRRWRRIWRGVPCVDIDHREFPRPPDIDRHALKDPDERRRASEDRIRRDMMWRVRFRDVADALLPSQSVRDTAPPPLLDAVRLRFSCLNVRAAWAWIRRGLERRPVAFHLRFDDDPLAFDEDDYPPAYHDDRDLGFPDLLFSNDGACASRLRTLHLAGMGLGDGLADALATDFPVLEDLQLQDCGYKFRRLASRSLKKLSMDNCGAEHGLWGNELVLAAPRLATLRIHGSPISVTMEDGMPSFAALSLTFTDDRALVLLKSLHGARSLIQSRFSTTAWLDLDAEEQQVGDLPVFCNLRTLLLDACDVGVECQVLRGFLQSAPCLESLKLRNCMFSGGSRSRKRKAPSSDRHSTTAYRCEKLKSVELEFNEGHIVSELVDALGDISKEVVQPIESSVSEGKRKVKILYK